MDDWLRTRYFTMGGLFVVLLLLGVVLNFFNRETGRTKTFVLPPDISRCKHDSDCALSNQIGCCPCEAGGGQGAVNGRMRPRLKEFLRKACGERATCLALVTCRDDLRPVCRAKRCTLLMPDSATGGEDGQVAADE